MKKIDLHRAEKKPSKIQFNLLKDRYDSNK
jgi:hypothetical protein